jgi:hypothetical protein
VIIALENKVSTTVLVLELPSDLTRMIRSYLDSVQTVVFPTAQGYFMSDPTFSKFSGVAWPVNRGRHSMANHLFEARAPEIVKESIATAMSTSLKTLHGVGARRVSQGEGVGSYLTNFTASRAAHTASVYMKSVLLASYLGFFCIKLKGETTIGKIVGVSDQGESNSHSNSNSNPNTNSNPN